MQQRPLAHHRAAQLGHRSGSIRLRARKNVEGALRSAAAGHRLKEETKKGKEEEEEAKRPGSSGNSRLGKASTSDAGSADALEPCSWWMCRKLAS